MRTFYTLTIVFIISIFCLPFAQAENRFNDDSWEFWNRNYAKKIKGMLDNGQTVVIAILGEEFSCNPSVVPDQVKREEFIKKYRNDTLDGTLITFVNNSYFADNPNFAVVERKAVEKILGELNFQQTGFVTKQMRDQIGNLLGVTHLLTVTGGRSTEISKPEGYQYTDSNTYKVIDMKLGKILSIDTCYTHRIGDQYTKWSSEITYSKNPRDYKYIH